MGRSNSHYTAVHGTLKLSAGTTALRGDILLERLTLNLTGQIQNATVQASYPIQYSGPVIETFSVTFPAPAMHGHYLVSYLDAQSGQKSTSVELIVQLPAV